MLIIFLSTILLLLIINNWFRMIKQSLGINVPGPFPLPLLGNAHIFMCDSSEFLNRLHQLSLKFGDAFRIHMFSTPCVVVSHPKYLEQLISSSEFITKGRTYRFLEPWLGEGLLTSTGQSWRAHRKFLTPAFHFNILHIYVPMFCKNSNILVRKLEDIPEGTDIDLFPTIALSSLDSVTESIMGVCLNAQEHSESEYVKALNEICIIISQRMQIAYLAEQTIFNLLPIKTRHDRALKVLHSQTNKVIAARIEEINRNNITDIKEADDIGMKNRYAFLDLLLLAEIDGKKIDQNRISDEVNTFMFEGYDTTTTGTSWTLLALSNHRDVQEKIYDELKTVFGDDMDRNPTFNELQKMKYLELVIKESMRLYSPVPIIERLIEKDCEIGKLKLVKGTTVMFNLFQLHRNPDLYENPLEFRPERFETPLKNPYNYLAFSAGPRNCIGQKFAMMAVKVALVGIIKNFIIVPSEKKPCFVPELVLKSKDGVHVKLYKRK